MISHNTPANPNINSETTEFQPVFSLDAFKQDAEQLDRKFEPVVHSEILQKLLEQISPIDFREKAGITEENQSLKKKHFLVSAIEEILNVAKNNNWGLCKNQSFIYLYNGAYWNWIEESTLKTFLGDAAEKMGVDKFDARHYQFKDELLKQFLTSAYLPKPEQAKETVLINLLNGTLEIGSKGQQLREPNSNDFITYQLPFNYDPKAKAPLFFKYLDRVQPDKDRQNILAEFLGYLFIKTSTLKLEKVLLLYGTGANGKSVFFDTVSSLLGKDNISNFSLQDLTNESGYYRAKIANKLVNYASEINNKLEHNIFKQLASGERVSARLPYGEPMEIEDYAKLIFNCNELPRNVEQTNAIFRRFLIVPFEETLPEEERDPELSKKIVESELSGVLNWVLKGLDRLLQQKWFTYSDAVENTLNEYKKRSDSVLSFLEEEGYEKSNSENDYIQAQQLFAFYKDYCSSNNNFSLNKNNFLDRLRNAGFETDKKRTGVVVFIKKAF